MKKSEVALENQGNSISRAKKGSAFLLEIVTSSLGSRQRRRHLAHLVLSAVVACRPLFPPFSWLPKTMFSFRAKEGCLGLDNQGDDNPAPSVIVRQAHLGRVEMGPLS